MPSSIPPAKKPSPATANSASAPAGAGLARAASRPTPTLERVRARLAAVGQDHLLHFYNDLDEPARLSLLMQIDELDLESIPALAKEYVLAKPPAAIPPVLRPARYYPQNPKSPTRPWDESKFRKVGQDKLRAGSVAAFTVAGGQGSRLGYEGPKGCYPAGAVTNKPLFAIFADGLLGAKDRYGRDVPWYIMTSPLNHLATVDFFEANGYFGLDRANVMFFPQGVMPSFDLKTGKVLLAEKGRIATNPDGHGGSIRALHESGALADMRRRAIDTISYFQVDNPIVNVLDPVFIGLHAAADDSSAEMSSKMVAKTDAAEKVGLFCTDGDAGKGRTMVIEYSDMPKALMDARNEDGSLKFNAGSIAVHIIGVEFAERLATDPKFSLPYHRAEKKVPHADLKSGEVVEPKSSNAVKLERFVFDALPLCRASIVYETDRVEEFAPIKNADEPGGAGKIAADSPTSSRLIQTLRAARWLEACGLAVPRKPDGTPDCILEISPRTGTTAAEVCAKLGKGAGARVIRAGDKVAL